jgi:hypothetical protein
LICRHSLTVIIWLGFNGWISHISVIGRQRRNRMGWQHRRHWL